MIKRRIDFEWYLPKTPEWSTMWEFRGKIYEFTFLLHPEFISYIWTYWRGRRLRALWSHVKGMIKQRGDACSTEQLYRDEVEYRSGMARIKEMMLAQLLK